MTREPASIDISAIPELARVARKVARTGRSCVLRQDGADVAVISPARSRARRAKGVTPEDIEAARDASWEGLVDGESLKHLLRAERGDDRPPVEL
jgi:hypothetical protein